MKIVDQVAERSTCDRGKPGCVLVKDNQILATGYAGSPPGFHHCDEVGHDMEERVRFFSYPPKNGDCNAVTNKKQLLSYVNNNESKGRWEMPASQHCIRTIHAEQNAILQAAKKGVALEGCTCYVSMTPCRVCTMMLISVGVKVIIAKNRYQKAQESIDMLEFAKIPIIHLSDSIQQYVK